MKTMVFRLPEEEYEAFKQYHQRLMTELEMADIKRKKQAISYNKTFRLLLIKQTHNYEQAIPNVEQKK